MSLLFINNEQIIHRLSKSCRKKRLLLNMTQETLATRANLSIPTVKKFEKGEAPSLRTVINILRALGEIDRLEGLISDVQESPRETFLREQNASDLRQRASGERD